MNQHIVLQNWLEKYQPLRIQHQITHTLSFCLNRKAKKLLVDYDQSICEAMRD